MCGDGVHKALTGILGYSGMFLESLIGPGIGENIKLNQNMGNS